MPGVPILPIEPIKPIFTTVRRSMSYAASACPYGAPDPVTDRNRPISPLKIPFFMLLYVSRKQERI